MYKRQDYYKSNPKARRRRLTQQKRYNKTSKGLKIRTAANKLNRKLGTYGNGDGKDASTPVKVKENLKHRRLTVVDLELAKSTHDTAVANP